MHRPTFNQNIYEDLLIENDIRFFTFEKFGLKRYGGVMLLSNFLYMTNYFQFQEMSILILTKNVLLVSFVLYKSNLFKKK